MTEICQYLKNKGFNNVTINNNDLNIFENNNIFIFRKL